MGLKEQFRDNIFLMEGALGERLKREYGLLPDEQLALGAHVYESGARQALTEMWQGYLAVAESHGFPFLATTPTRRLNRDRIKASRYGDEVIRENVRLLKELQRQSGHQMFAGVLIGCKGDAYRATEVLGEGEAEAFHTWSIERFAACGVDFFFAGIMPALSEAAGMARALSAVRVPYIVSFMIRENGRLMDGTSIHDAVSYIDNSVANPPLCYMTNCVHPEVLYRALECSFNRTGTVRERFCGIQANTSPLPPEELDQAEQLHLSDPQELAQGILRLKEWIKLKIAGGCCGTDTAYMEAIAGKLKQHELRKDDEHAGNL